VLLGWAAWSARYVMDEMALLSVFNFFGDIYNTADPIKTVLATYYFNAPRLIAHESVELLQSARVLGLLLACAMAATAYRVGKALNASPFGALLATASLLTYSNFTERAFRLRTDNGAAAFAVLALWATVSSERATRRTVLAGLAAGFAFLCTQKAAFAAVSLGLGFLFSRSWVDRGWRRCASDALRFAAAWTIPLFVYSAVFGGRRFSLVLASVLVSPAKFALETAHAYQGLSRYIASSLRQNALLYTFSALALLIVFRNWSLRSERERAAAISAVAMSVLVFSHSQPWPYTFVVLQCFLAPWIAFLFGRTAQLSTKLRRSLGWGLTAALLLSIPRAISFPLVQTNRAQLAAIREIEPLLSPTDRYFDGLGMLPARRLAGSMDDWWWDRPALFDIGRELRNGNISRFERIFLDHPKVWLLNYRTAALLPSLGQRLAGSYVRVSPLALLSGTAMSAGQSDSQFFCLWPGNYLLVDGNGRPIGERISIGSDNAGEEVWIDYGAVSVHRESAMSTAYLIPADVHLNKSIPSPTVRFPDLFVDVYDF